MGRDAVRRGRAKRMGRDAVRRGRAKRMGRGEECGGLDLRRGERMGSEDLKRQMGERMSYFLASFLISVIKKSRFDRFVKFMHLLGSTSTLIS